MPTTTPGYEDLVREALDVPLEGWEPNLPVARERLEPLGVEVLRWAGGRIPTADR